MKRYKFSFHFDSLVTTVSLNIEGPEQLKNYIERFSEFDGFQTFESPDGATVVNLSRVNTFKYEPITT